MMFLYFCINKSINESCSRLILPKLLLVKVKSYEPGATFTKNIARGSCDLISRLKGVCMYVYVSVWLGFRCLHLL